MSRRCELTGKGPMVGNNSSHANNKTKRRYLPNLNDVTLQSETLGRGIKLRITAAALRSVDHRGGLDAFLAKARDEELSPRVLKVKKEIAKGEWFAAHPREEFSRTESTPLEIVGDQVKGSEWEGQVPKETLSVRYAGRDKDGRIEPVEPDPASPILLLGDSHTLVFQEGASGGMHCQGAGLLDQLAHETGIVPDLVGVRGSGLVQARKQLYRAAAPVDGYWENKKVVVWVFSVREFTQSFDKIMEIPIEKPQ